MLNIRSLAAYERARRALRGVCEPSAYAHGAMRRVRFLVRVTRPQEKKKAPCLWCFVREFRLWRRFARSAPAKRACRSSSGKCEPSAYAHGAMRRVRFLVRVIRPQEKKKAPRLCSAIFGNLLRPTRLPSRKRRSNVANPAHTRKALCAG